MRPSRRAVGAWQRADKIAAKMAAYRERNRDKIAAKMAAYRERNRRPVTCAECGEDFFLSRGRPPKRLLCAECKPAKRAQRKVAA